LWREETRKLRKEFHGARQEHTTNLTHIQYGTVPESNPRQHCWEASTNPTASSLLPLEIKKSESEMTFLNFS